MEVKINAIHFEISDRLVAFINKKLDKLSRRYEDILAVNVNLKVVKPETALNKEAGIQIDVAGANNLFASKTCDTFEEAIDLSLEALEHQLERLKDKK